MSDRHDNVKGRGPSGPPPTQDHSASEKAPKAPNLGDSSAIDPDVLENLGAEFPLRGDQLEHALEEAKAEAEQWRETAMRAQADSQNTRRRLEGQHAEALLRAGKRIVTEVLPVIDDLERAIDHITGADPELAEGIVAVHRKLLGVLAKEGVSAIDPLGQPFDHDMHNAVQMQEDLEVADHTVVAVFQKGYAMHGQVLRPAMVVVSTGGPAGK